jgi:RNA polymerase sigma factor (sigma-70 family)
MSAPSSSFIADWAKRWRKPIRSWLNRQGIPGMDVDDLAQEVFIRLLRYPPDEVVENPAGYLFRIAANVASEYRQLSRVRKTHDESWLDDLPIDPAYESESILEREQTNRMLQAVIDTLPSRQRQILFMHVYDRLTYKQIGAELGLTYRTVLRDLTRAYAYLRKNVELIEF